MTGMSNEDGACNAHSRLPSDDSFPASSEKASVAPATNSELDVLAASQAVVDVIAVGKDTGPFPDCEAFGLCVVTQHLDTSRCWPDKIEQEADDSRFSCTVRTEETEDFPVVNRQRDVFDSLDRAEPLCQSVDLDCSHCSPLETVPNVQIWFEW